MLSRRDAGLEREGDSQTRAHGGWGWGVHSEGPLGTPDTAPCYSETPGTGTLGLARALEPPGVRPGRVGWPLSLPTHLCSVLGPHVQATPGTGHTAQTCSSHTDQTCSSLVALLLQTRVENQILKVGLRLRWFQRDGTAQSLVHLIGNPTCGRVLARAEGKGGATSLGKQSSPPDSERGGGQRNLLGGWRRWKQRVEPGVRSSVWIKSQDFSMGWSTVPAI